MSGRKPLVTLRDAAEYVVEVAALGNGAVDAGR
jgi:hypothetical protein